MKKEKLELENEFLTNKRKKKYSENLMNIRKNRLNIENILIKQQLLSQTYYKPNKEKIEYAKNEILDFLESQLIVRIREFDYLLEKCSKDIEPLKTNIVFAEFTISQDKMNEIISKKRMLKEDISDLLIKVLSLDDIVLNLAIYLFVNKINKTEKNINEYNVEYFNLTGGLTEELKYLRRLLKN